MRPNLGLTFIAVIIAFCVVSIMLTTINKDERKFCEFYDTKLTGLEQCECGYRGSDNKCYNMDYINKYCPQVLQIEKLNNQLKDLGIQLKNKDAQLKDRNRELDDMDFILSVWKTLFFMGIFASILTFYVMVYIHESKNRNGLH
jgi:hypothetical protein